MSDHLSSLRQQLAALALTGAEGAVRARREDLFALGFEALDRHLGGGLARGALHELYAERLTDTAAATACGLALAVRAGGARPLVWVRQAFLNGETGAPFGPGLAEHGLDPARLILVSAPKGQEALRAAAEAVRCRAVGAVILELWGEPRALDLTASRRLSLAAAQSGTPLFLIRVNAQPVASAATSRWQVSASSSVALEANAPGHPAFVMTLLRHRAGSQPRTWLVEWNREQQAFAPRGPISGGVVYVPGRRPTAAPLGQTPDNSPPDWRRAG
jgi:protein ImuA